MLSYLHPSLPLRLGFAGPLAALLLAVAGASAPVVGGAPASPAAPAPTAVRDGTIRLHYWSPERGELNELFDWAFNAFYRDVPRYDGDESGGSTENLFLLGDSIVIYDTDEYAARVISALEDLDQAWRRSAPPAEIQYIEFEYTPRFLSLDAVRIALQQHVRRIVHTEGYRTWETENLRAVDERGVLMILDLPERVAQMRALLERIDRPQPQVLLTCYLVRGKTGASGGRENGAPLPVELTRNLARLVPYESFETVSTGFLRTAAAPGAALLLDLPSGQNQSYQLQATTAAYDAAGGGLTLERCRFQRSSGTNSDGNRIAVQTIFETNTSVPSDEYVVLGASGTEPLFVVLHVQPAGK